MPGVLARPNWTERLPIYAWTIEHPEGVIVVDTGETARTSDAGYFPRCAFATGEPTVYLPSHDPDAARRLAECECIPRSAPQPSMERHE